MRFWNSSRLVVGLFVLLAAFFNAAVVPLHDWLRSWIDAEVLYPGFMGIACGEFCVLVLISALTSRTWLRGYLLGLAIACFWYLALMLGTWLTENMGAMPLVLVCTFPALLLIGSAPLVVLRYSGWLLARGNEVIEPIPPFRIADLFHGTAFIAASLTLVRVPQVIQETEPGDFWPVALVIAGILFAIGLLAMPAAVWLAFGLSRHRAKSVLGLIVLAGMAYSIVILISQFFFAWGATWDQRSEVLRPIASSVVACVSVLYAFLVCYRASGIVLVRRPRQQGTQPGREPDHDRESSQRWFVGSGRWTTAIAIAIAAAVSVWLAGLQSWRRAQDEEIARLSKIAQGLGGRVHSSDRKVVGIELPLSAADSTIEQFLTCRSLNYLIVKSKNLTDRSIQLIATFESLHSLSLDGAAITDQGLQHLGGLKSLSDLSLINTSISGAGLRPLAARAGLTELSLKGSGIADQDCEELSRFWRLLYLSLNGTAVTDKGLHDLRQLHNLHHLDLSDTAVDGSGIQGYDSLGILSLNRTQLTDESVGALADRKNLSQLYISGTGITDRAIDQLVQFPRLASLDLSWTKVTDAGIARLAQSTSIKVLNLSGTSTTGECFRQWPAAQLDILDLSGTLVIDATLPHAARLGVSELGVSGTKLTATGILAAGFVTLSILHVGQGQFSESEIEQLEAGLPGSVHVVEGTNQSM